MCGLCIYNELRKFVSIQTQNTVHLILVQKFHCANIHSFSIYLWYFSVIKMCPDATAFLISLISAESFCLCAFLCPQSVLLYLLHITLHCFLTLWFDSGLSSYLIGGMISTQSMRAFGQSNAMCYHSIAWTKICHLKWIKEKLFVALPK